MPHHTRSASLFAALLLSGLAAAQGVSLSSGTQPRFVDWNQDLDRPGRFEQREEGREYAPGGVGADPEQQAGGPGLAELPGRGHDPVRSTSRACCRSAG